MLAKEDLAKYPFLQKAAAFIEGRNLSISDLAGPEFSNVVRRAVERVRSSILGEEVTTDTSDPETEILSYPLALAFVYASKIRWLVNRFATSEAKRCEEELRKEPISKLEEIGNASFGWKVEAKPISLEWEKLDFRLGVWQYLEVAPQFHSVSWKLTNKYLKGGHVYLKAKDFARLLAENLKLRIVRRASEEEIRKFDLPQPLMLHLEGLLKLAEERKGTFEEEAPQGLVDGAIPPCIQAIMGDLASGKSVSHMARFAITTFMINVGEGVEDVLRRFGNVADFDEGKARYQVEHIAGMSGSRTKYSPPKCDVLRSFGLCVNPDRTCSRVTHPLRYYRLRLKDQRRDGGAAQGSRGGGGKGPA
uniref:DNA primase large subunit PriL n=1 Tax=Candidatus Methanomethylicus mesodigestus TaxID=1867258 RepID=A0A7C3F121_9CREN